MISLKVFGRGESVSDFVMCFSLSLNGLSWRIKRCV